MSEMKLVFPTMAYKERVIEFVNEFYEYGSELHGSGALDQYLKEATYEEWLDKVIKDIDIANVVKPRVPALTYFCVSDEGDILGMVNLRLALNDFLRKEGGHIGYCVRPTRRRNRVGTEQLKCALEVYDTLGISEILISCDKENAASAGVICNCGGVLEEEFYGDTYQGVLQRYVIHRG